MFLKLLILIGNLAIVLSRNILLVITDDMGADQIHNLPNHTFFNEASILNTLSVFPVCGPSRAALLTGLRPDTTKIYNFETYLNRENMFSYFKNKGYDTFVTGKIFHTLGTDSNKQFEWNMGYLTSPRLCTFQDNSGCPAHKFYCKVRVSQDQCSIDSVIDFFKSRVGNPKPWIAGVGFRRPHLLLSMTRNLKKTYIEPIDYRTPDNFKYSLSNFQHKSLGYIKVPVNGKFVRMLEKGDYPFDFFVNKNEKTIKLMRNAYAQSSMETIQNFLKVVDSLNDILPNSQTDIVFISDHGFQIGQRKIIGKNTLYPEATNIPLFFKAYSKKPVVSNEYYSSIDIFPTLLELHSFNYKLDGVSIFSAKKPLSISQYPRCQKLGEIQTNDCMNGEGKCDRAPILYMGYVIVKNIQGTVYRFSEWYPFNEIRNCGWPYWDNIPKQFVNNLGENQVWNTNNKSGTIFINSINRELYVGNDYYTNMASDPKYKSVIEILSKLIKTPF